MKYAANTGVSTEKSRAEIEKILGRYDASRFAYMNDAEQAMIAFEIKEKRIRFVLPLPEKDQFSRTPGGRRTRKADSQYKAWEQACRQRWRALALAIKAKLEWTETGIVTIEEEFLPYIVTGNGKTVAEILMPQLNQLYMTGKIPRLLPESVS